MPTCEQVDRALRLADHLEKVAAEWPEHFDMESWVGDLDSAAGWLENNDPRYLMHIMGQHPEQCGTTGCALGWCPYALGIEKRQGEPWEKYAERVLGVHPGMDFIRLFVNMVPPTHGAEGARHAAERLREWAEKEKENCEEVE